MKATHKETNKGNYDLTYWTSKTSARRELDRGWGTKIWKMYSSYSIVFKVGPKLDEQICKKVTFMQYVLIQEVAMRDLGHKHAK